MGWWWSSSASTEAPQQPSPSIQITTTSTPTQQPTLAERNETSFAAAFPHLSSSSSSSSSAAANSAPTTNPQDTASPAPEDDPSIPKSMSCRAAFDSAFYCSSLGGHFNDIYRYGQLRSCSEHWADWRFCMSLKSYSKEMQEQAIRERYLEKEEKMKKLPNSEDVWRRRGPGERIVRPFGKAGEV